jgi:uncharacterized protein
MKEALKSRRPSSSGDPGAEKNLRFETGRLSKEELEALLNSIPLDLTYVGSEDTLKYYNRSTVNVFDRSPGILGRTVQKCHPRESVPQVIKILNELKSGRRDSIESWTRRGERTIHIRYLAVRGKNGRYLGTLETAQDTTDLKPSRTKGYS